MEDNNRKKHITASIRCAMALGKVEIEEQYPKPKPPLGKIKFLHQSMSIEETDVCIHCGKPNNEWMGKGTEVCPVHTEDKRLMGFC